MKTRWKKYLKSSNGFSLVEVMVAAGMLGVVSLGVMQLSKNINKSSKAAGQQMGIIELESAVTRALYTEDPCTDTLENINYTAIDGDGTNIADGVTITEINGLGGNVVAGTGSVYGQGAGKITINRIKVQDWNETTTDFSFRYGTVKVLWEIEKGSSLGSAGIKNTKHKDSSYGSRVIVKKSSEISVKVDLATDLIVNCYSGYSSILADACNSLEGYLNPVTSRCENIKINNNSDGGTPEQTRKYAITTRGTTAGNSEGSIKAEGGLVVGNGFTGVSDFDTDTTGPGIGNAVIRRSLTVGSDTNFLAPTGLGSALFQRSLKVGNSGATSTVIGDGIFDNDLTVGRDTNITRNLDVNGTTDVLGNTFLRAHLKVGNGLTGNPGAGDATFQNEVLINPVNNGSIPAAGESLRVESGVSRFFQGTSQTNLNTANNTGVRVDTNYTNSKSIRVATSSNVEKFTVGPLGALTMTTNGTNHTFNVNSNGTVTVWSNGGTAFGDRRIILASGAVGDSYRPSYIYNMPPYSSGSMTGTQEREIPTKKWVLDAVYNSLSDNVDLGSLMQSVSESIASQPFTAVLANICDNIRVRFISPYGTTTTSGVMSGANCTIDVNDDSCGYSTASRCSPTHYSQNYDATGNLEVDGSTLLRGATTVNNTLTVTGSYIYASSGYVRASSYLRAGSYVTAGTYIAAGSYITAGSYIRANNNINSTNGNITADAGNIIASSGSGMVKANGGSGSQGICGKNGCATRFGRWRCTGGGVVVGMAYGTPMCAKVMGKGVTGYTNM